MKQLIAKVSLVLAVVAGVGFVAEANGGKAALKAVSYIAKKIKPTPAAKIVNTANRTTVSPAVVPVTAGLISRSSQSCGTCGGTGKVTCFNCNFNGQVFVAQGFDMFGNPIGQWLPCPMCNGTKERSCPSCR